MGLFQSMYRSSWTKAAAVAMVGASILLAGCGGGGTKTASKEGSGSKKQVLTMASTNAPKTLNPVAATDTTAQMAVRMMFDSLLGEPEANKFSNHLAESFTTKDKQTYTVKLNKKAKWTDGKPFTVDDIIFSLNLYANPKVETFWNQYFKFLEGVKDNGKLADGVKTISGLKKIDDYTLEFKCKVPLDENYVKEKLGFNVLYVPKHIYEKLDPTKISAAQEANKPAVFNGPYKLVKHVANDHLEFAANDEYYRGKPKLKTIFLKIQNGTNMVVDLKAGKVQMSCGDGIGKLPMKDVELLKKEKHLLVKNVPSMNPQVMEINNKHKEFNKDFRLALCYAINRKQIVDQIYKGYSYVNPTVYTKASPAFEPNALNPEYNPEKAKELLKKSGFDLNRELTLLVPVGNVPREQSADIIEQNLRAIGLKIKEQKMDFPTLIGEVRKGEFDFALRGMDMQADPDSGARLYQPGSLGNWSYVDDSQLVKMFNKAALEADSAKRITMYKDIQKYLAENQFHIDLYGEEDFIIQDKSLVGGIKPYWFGSLDNIHEWYFK